MNPRVTKKERGLIKGALRRVFSRSELRNAVVEAALVDYEDETRPRVKKWFICNICKKPEAKSYAVVDHIDPFVPLDTQFEDMSLDTAVDRLWCEKNNLQVVDKECHNKKSREENKIRRTIQNGKSGKSNPRTSKTSGKRASSRTSG